MINDYIDLYQEGKITLEGLWYNIQTPLFLLFKKEEQLQVQVKRNQANLFFIASKRESEPAARTRAVRKVPSLNAHTATIAATTAPAETPARVLSFE